MTRQERAERGALTDQQASFVEHYMTTGDHVSAAKLAGYSHPSGDGLRLLRLEHIRSAIARAIDSMFTGRLVPKAATWLARALTDPAIAPRDKNTAAAIVMRTYKELIRDNDATKGLHEMSSAELAERIQTLERAKSEKARPVIEAEPVSEWD